MKFNNFTLATQNSKKQIYQNEVAEARKSRPKRKLDFGFLFTAPKNNKNMGFSDFEGDLTDLYK